MDLYLIRHAQSTNNQLTNRMDRGHDPSLTELGQRQAAYLAEYLGQKYAVADGRPIRLYTSPMLRALQTANIVMPALGVKPEIWVDIHERGGVYAYGPDTNEPIGYPGKTRSEIETEFPDFVLSSEVDESGWWHGNRERRDASYARAIRVAAELLKHVDNEERLFLITHGGFMDFLVKTFLHQLPAEHLFYYNRNTGISHLGFNAEGQVMVYYLNRVYHLPPELLT